MTDINLSEEILSDPASSRSMLDTPGSADDETATLTSISRRQAAINQVSPRARAMLLFIFCVAQFLDTCIGGGMVIATSQISQSLDLELSQSVWIVTTYMLTFAAFTLFAGRVSDLFSPPIVFECAIIGVGVSAIINSFLETNKYAFLVVRTLSGVAAAFTIPPAYNLIAAFYPGEPKKIGLPGLAGCLGGIIGLVLAGLCMLASWQWFLRLVGILALIPAGVAAFLLPFDLPAQDPHDRLKRLDIPGVVLLGGALVCFLLALTEGPILGYSDPHFYGPFVASMVAFIAFGIWEAIIPARTAALPMVFWKGDNVIPATLVTMLCSSMITVIQLDFSNYWQLAAGWSPLHVAAGLLPLSLTGVLVALVFQKISYFTTKPRWVVLGTLPLNIVAWLLFYFSDTPVGNGYWAFAFTSQFISCIGGFTIYLSASANLIASFPPEAGGVAGAFIISIAQISQSIYLAVAAGLATSDAHDWRTSFGRIIYFGIPMSIILTLQYVVFYRDVGSFEEQHNAARARIAGDEKVTPDLGAVEKEGKSVVTGPAMGAAATVV